MPILQPVASTSPSISPDGLISAAVRLMPSRTKPVAVQARASASDNQKIAVRARTEPERRLSIVPSNVLAGPLTQARGGAPKGQPGVAACALGAAVTSVARSAVAHRRVRSLDRCARFLRRVAGLVDGLPHRIHRRIDGALGDLMRALDRLPAEVGRAVADLLAGRADQPLLGVAARQQGGDH